MGGPRSSAAGGTDGRDKRVPPAPARAGEGGGGRDKRVPPVFQRGLGGTDATSASLPCNGRTWSLPCNGRTWTRQARPSRQNRLSGMKQLARTCPFTTVEETEMDRPLNCLNGSSHWPVSATVISPVSAWKDSTTSSRGE